MCGLTGFLSHRCHHANQSATIISAMTASLKHRGPNDSGTWINQEDGIALGHQRLAILDLSAAGHQPMHSNNERYVIAYNGEIYNFL